MPNPPEVLANEGTSAQLPRGAASAINDQAEEGRALAEAAPTAEAPTEEDYMSAPELQPAAPADYEPIQDSENEDDDFITGSTTRPDEAVTTGAFAGASQSLPPDLVAALPVFQEAASLPDAPPQLQLLLKMLLDAAGS